MQSTIKHEVSFLDFLRGWSAVFVFFHHAAILGGGPSILRGFLGQEAVNAFMLASGFLIYYQCSISKSYQQLTNKIGIQNFFIRRFFRIAPAYYFCLFIALLLSNYLGECRELIAEVLPNSATSMDRYYINEPIKSFFIHASFIFGVIPEYSFSTPLPDWSLGLEMQFYFIFPFLYFFYKKNFTLFFTISLVGMFCIWWISNLINFTFPMPSYLPLKFQNFAGGIALAYLFLNKSKISFESIFISCVTLFFLIVGNKTIIIPFLYLFSWWWICFDSKKENILIQTLSYIIGHRVSKFLAEMSYSVYIAHLILMIPFFALVLNRGKLDFVSWTAFTTMLLFGTFLFSYIIYRFIELKGIKLGKKLIKLT
ncbi:acyltransferase family protein [Flavobacterium sp. W21_SRS_FM6]|uniref:acyltransferase family protein n=1 Tax=Flavobacterium sp. W21_SRS_FM6 TaxID=3240268 RepID=UPI003F8F8EB8